MPLNLVVTIIVVAVLYAFNMWTFTEPQYRERKAIVSLVVLLVLVMWLLFGWPSSFRF